MLFQTENMPDRSKTQLSYAAQYLPWELACATGAETLVAWRKRIYIRKGTMLQLLNEEMTTLCGSYTNKQEYIIHWRYNAIPTQMEWEAKSFGYILEVDLRIVKGVGPVAILSF